MSSKEEFIKDFVKLCQTHGITRYCQIENKISKTSNGAYYLNYLEMYNGTKIYASEIINALKEK